jgi:hypothetical protein
MILNKPSSRWASYLAAWLLPLGAGAQATAAADVQAAPFDAALVHLERCQWPQAFAQLAELADTGHPEAARIALLMHAHGTRLFGGSFKVQAPRRERWLDVASAAGLSPDR